MNTKVYEFSDYSVEVVHDPATALPQNLQDELVTECTALSRDSFGNPAIKESFVKNCIFNSSTVLFGRDYEGKLFGYSSNRVFMAEDYHIIYLQSLAISERYQGVGLRRVLNAIKILEEVNKIRKNDINLEQILLAIRTQNPLVFKFGARDLGMFPQPNGTMDQEIKRISKQFIDCLSGKQVVFDDHYFVERGTYKAVTKTSLHGVYPLGIPFCRDDDEINDYMNQHLNWQNGDALILLGYYNHDVFDRMFEEVQQRLGFCGIQALHLDEAMAVSHR